MKRPLIKSCYVLLVISSLIPSCTQQEPEVDVKKEFINVNENDYLEFVQSYEKFISSLNSENREDFKSFIDASIPRRASQARTSNDAQCKCLSNMATCSASGKLSSCCICWDPRTHEGACGTYFGIASCKIEKKEGVTIKPGPPNLITVYPIEFDGLFEYANSKNVDVIEIHAALKKLEANAL